ncbi:LexA family transcriptional regulator [Legionella sp. CNM-4043-24]|uniref:LexA family transcriptional regulator n=1 Tax=Legionella sp. CNM-4043-24 TaxID=3421646 RepID=UPI00403AB02D
MITKGKKPLFLGKNLNYLLTQNALDIKHLSAETGIPTATLARLKRDGTNPTLSSIEPLLDFFRVDINAFLYEDMSDPDWHIRKKMGDMISIPVFSLDEVGKGRGQATVSMFIAAAGISGLNVFGVSINSDRLAPAFQNNSIVIIDPDLKPMESDYVLCILGNRPDASPVFRQLFMDGDDYYFKPVNPGFGEMKQYEHFQLLGVIIKSIESWR